jgi:hypothetical protein
MKKHQIVAIIVGTLLSIVSFIPVYLTWAREHSLEYLGHPMIVKVFIFPTVGVGIAAVLIFFSFFKDGKK